MIQRSFALALIIFTSYNFLHWKIAPDSTITRHPWQVNNLIAQEFLYNSDSYENVIVGTSISQRLPKEKLREFYNLSFAGLSCMDGLELVTYKRQLPKRVFIETNFFNKPRDQSFTETLENPVLFNLRKYVPELREGRQPLDWASVPFDRTEEKINTNDRRSELIFEVQEGRYSKTPHRGLLNKSIAELRGYVDRLTAKGVQVIFFEMPVNPALCNATFAVAIREAMESEFPKDRYRYIPIPDCADYEVPDGIHLGDDEAMIYAEYFRKNAF